jgi:hypothetical protein
MKSSYKKSASLTFRGFTVAPEVVQSMVGIDAKLLGEKGLPMRSNRSNVWRRSVAQFEIEFADDFPIDGMVPALLNHATGVENLCAVRDRISPEFIEVNLVLPIKFSESQDDGFLEIETLGDLYELQATLGFSFV